MKTFVKENTWLKPELIKVGWGNGYVAIPKGHKLHGLSYDAIYEKADINVHGGLTFASSYEDCKEWEEVTEDLKGCWIVGFDTAHYNDNKDNCNKEYVINETENLKSQLEKVV